MTLTPEQENELELQLLVYKNLQDAAVLTNHLANDWVSISFSPNDSQAMNDFRKVYYQKLTDLKDVFGTLEESFVAICEQNECEYV